MGDQVHLDFLSRSRDVTRATGDLLDVLRESAQATHRSIDDALRSLKESREALDRASQLTRWTSRHKNLRRPQ